MIKSQLHLFLWTLIAQSIFTVVYWSLLFFKDLYILGVLTFSHWWINAVGSCSLLGWETPCKKKSGFMVLIFDCWQLLSLPSTSSAPHVALGWIWKWLERARKGGLFGVSLLLEGGAGARVPAPRLNFCQHRRREHLACSSAPSLTSLAIIFPVGATQPLWDTVGRQSLSTVWRPGQVSSCGFEPIILSRKEIRREKEEWN